MLTKNLYPVSLIFFCYFLIACHHNESNHKNNDTQLKSAPEVTPELQMDASKTIAENILMDTSLSILCQSLKTSGLYEVLTKPGPFTFFAPLDTAFKNLPEGTLESLMKDRKNDLANILSHHIVAGLIQNKDLQESQKLKTLAGDELIVTKRNDEIIINGVKINTRGSGASNGIIYTTDNLFFPKSKNPGAY